MDKNIPVMLTQQYKIGYKAGYLRSLQDVLNLIGSVHPLDFNTISLVSRIHSLTDNLESEEKQCK